MNIILRLIATAICIVTSFSLYAADQATLQKQLATLEAQSGGKLGIAAINTANQQRLEYRGDERFPMCCTAKVMTVAAVLKKSMTDKDFLQQKITYTKKDIDAWAPVTKKHVADGMTIEDLSAAAIMQSDNTALNLLITKLGGFHVVNDYARSVGDNTFRVDRFEPDATVITPGDPRDTNTPTAMLNSLQTLALGHALSLSKREQLQTWLKGNTLGAKRIRAGVPAGWVVGDKTGTGTTYGATNDIGIIWPPHCAPIIVALYYTSHNKTGVKREDVLASATKMIIKEFARNDKCLEV